MGKATIDDVAKAAGVSTFTVSRALRGKEHVAESTRQRVLEAAKSLNYTASKAASSLASGHTNRIALLARERLAGWFIGQFLDGLVDVLSQQQYDVIPYRAGSPNERDHFFQNLPAKRNADALIITGFSASQQEEHALKDLGMPIVLVNAPTPSYCQASVAIDDVLSEASAVRYLAALGHRKFAYIGRVDTLTGNDWGFDARARGYMDAVTELNLTNCGMYQIDASNPRSAKQIVASLLSLPEHPTAICVWSDYFAVPIMHELMASGLQIPRDISVMGHDGSDMATSLEITTMAQPARKIGRLAAQKALDLINERPMDEVHTVLTTTLEPGTSTGPLN